MNLLFDRLDVIRFAVADDAGRQLSEWGVTTRQQVAERIGVHIDYVPDLDTIHGPVQIGALCCGCQRVDAWDESKRKPCQDDATRMVVLGCVHEHLVALPICADHLTDTDMWCAQCSDGLDNPMSVIPVSRDVLDRWCVEMMVGRLPTSEQAEGRVFIAENLDRLVPPHLRETP